MRLLDRYVLRELLIPLGYCLSGFLIIIIAADLAVRLGDFQKKNLGWDDIFDYYVATLPEQMPLLLPMALLLALLYALSNHARHQELTAMRAAGLGLWRLSAPYFAVGLMASLALLVSNEFWQPGSSEAARRILLRHQPPPPGSPPPGQVRNLVSRNSRDGRQWVIGVYHERTGEMANVVVIWTQPDGASLHYEAARAVWEHGVWTFRNVSAQKEFPEQGSVPVPLLKTNVLAMPQFTETPEQIRSEIKISEMAKQRIRKDFKESDIPIAEIRDYLRLHPDLTGRDSDWLYTKLFGRLAGPWTCLVAVLIAIPFGAASGRRNVYVGVASSILIFLSFWVLQQLALALGTAGGIRPWLAAWAPNLIFGCAGLAMTARAG